MSDVSRSEWIGFGPSRKRLCVCALLLAELVPGCMSSSVPPARYQGRALPLRALPNQIQDLLVPPPNYEVIGKVSANCRSYRQLPMDGKGDCSTYLLIRLLAVKASESGGEAMVGRHCDSDRDVSEGLFGVPARTEAIECDALVVRQIGDGGPSGVATVTNTHSVPAQAAEPASTTAAKKQKLHHGRCSKLPCAL